MKIFYCAKCKKEHIDFFITRDELRIRETWVNPRDFYGTPIHHMICPHCGYVLSGFMEMRNVTMEDLKSAIDYVKYTISLYSSKDMNGMIEHENIDFICDKKIKDKKDTLSLRAENNIEIQEILNSMCKFDD
jgi:hypothetical protein